MYSSDFIALVEWDYNQRSEAAEIVALDLEVAGSAVVEIEDVIQIHVGAGFRVDDFRLGSGGCG
jgi:hypothetical protein